jgi:hypothetical protein
MSNVTGSKAAASPGMTRRAFGLGLGMTAVAASGCGRRENAPPPQAPAESATVTHARRFAEANLPPDAVPLMIENARLVDRDFSTAPVRAQVAGRIYEWPANYTTPKARSDLSKYAVPGADRYELPSEDRRGIGGLTFFWPTLEGYSPTNWVDDGDRRRIDYLSFAVHGTDASLTVEQVMARLHRSRVIEATPGITRFGLSGYRWIKPDGSHQDRVEWIGPLRDGGLFHMHSRDPDSQAAQSLFNPQCAVDMFDRESGEDVSYRFSLSLIEHWRAIEHGTRRIIRGWRRA